MVFSRGMPDIGRPHPHLSRMLKKTYWLPMDAGERGFKDAKSPCFRSGHLRLSAANPSRTLRAPRRNRRRFLAAHDKSKRYRLASVTWFLWSLLCPLGLGANQLSVFEEFRCKVRI
jgi:hypothetical protein